MATEAGSRKSLAMSGRTVESGPRMVSSVIAASSPPGPERHGGEASRLAAVGLDDRVVGNGELRDPLEDLLERDAHFHPGEVRPETAVVAAAEGEVAIGLPVQHDLAGLLERVLVTVDRRQRQGDPIP